MLKFNSLEELVLQFFLPGIVVLGVLFFLWVLYESIKENRAKKQNLHANQSKPNCRSCTTFRNCRECKKAKQKEREGVWGS